MAAYCLAGRDAALAAPGPRGRARPRRRARRGRDGHRVGQVAGLPAAGAHRDPRRVEGRAANAASSTLYLAPTKALAQDQRASIARARARRPGRDARRRQHPGAARLDPRPRRVRPHQPRHAASLDAARPTTAGHDSSRPSTSSSSTSATTTAACSAPTSRRCCAGSAGSAPPYGASPTFVLASATVAEPEVAGRPADRLRGRCRHRRRLPPRRGRGGAVGAAADVVHRGAGAPVRRPAPAETADLLADLVVEGVRTLAFVRSRRGVEQVAQRASDLLAEVEPALAARVDSYRGGYLPEERRALEDDLRSGRLLGMAATNALELGIDVSGLDAVLDGRIPRHPGGVLAAGRAGRPDRRWRARHAHRPRRPARHLPRPPSGGTARPAGRGHGVRPRQSLCPRVRTSAQLRRSSRSPIADLALFGPTARGLLDDLTEAGLLRRRPSGWYWTDRRRAADLADIRSTGGAQVQLVEAETGRVVGTVDGGRAHTTAHTGAVYVHRGETWQVERLDLDEHVAEIAPRRRRLHHHCARHHGHHDRRRARPPDVGPLPGVVRVGRREQPGDVVPQRRRTRTGEVIDETTLDLPVRTLRTSAVWWTVPDDVLADAGLDRADLPGAAHAAEHCSIGLLPLFATCDRWDIGGVSTARHPDTGVLTVFVHDGHPGGAGFAERGYATAREWLTATRATIAACECVERLSVLHPVAQVRQRQRPARQGRGGPAARRVARSLSGRCQGRSPHAAASRAAFPADLARRRSAGMLGARRATLTQPDRVGNDAQQARCGATCLRLRAWWSSVSSWSFSAPSSCCSGCSRPR